MAKKQFSSGLDSLFADAPEALEGGPMSEVSVRQPSERRVPSVKSFASDLDALLHEALEESLGHFEDGTASTPTGKSKTSAGSRPRASSGLDSLIRQTIDVQELTRDEETGVRRLTVAVDRTKLEKLKTIARLENSYLKDLLVGLIDEYITDYTKEKGVDL
jgi:hypothetical protein